jgi:hypothetical protein
MAIQTISTDDTASSSAATIVERLIKLAEAFPGQPVAVVQTEGGLQVGVMNLLNPTDEDWCLRPVPLTQLTRPVSQSVS